MTTTNQKTMVTLTLQDVTEMFCPLDLPMLKALTKLINETQYRYPNELIYKMKKSDWVDHTPLFETVFKQFKQDAMSQLERLTGILREEYEVVESGEYETNTAYYEDYEDYAAKVQERLPQVLKKDPAITLSPLCIWFLKQINVQL